MNQELVHLTEGLDIAMAGITTLAIICYTRSEEYTGQENCRAVAIEKDFDQRSI